MRPDQRFLTIILHRDGELQSRSYRVPLWLLRVTLISGLCLAAAIILGAALYLPLLRTAARVPGMTQDVIRLEAENAKIRQLVAALDTAESRYAQVRQMLGGDVVPDPVAFATTLPVAPALHARAPGSSSRFESGPSVPRHWPLDDPGYITQGQVGTGTRDEAHPGIDIAIPTGTMVRAAGGGNVLQSGTDPEYGTFVLLQHPDGYQTMYGHLSRITTAPSDSVAAGQVIGVSGNTGRSSAPHLHFEIRRDGRSLDPLTMVREGS